MKQLLKMEIMRAGGLLECTGRDGSDPHRKKVENSDNPKIPGLVN